MSRKSICLTPLFAAFIVAECALCLGADKIYWSSSRPTEQITRANLDGSGVETVLTVPSPQGFGGIACDVAHGFFYSGDYDYLFRADLNADLKGLTRVNLILTHVHAVKLDLAAGKVYWSNTLQSDTTNRAILRANLDGTNVEKVASVDQYALVFSLALDPSAGKVYYTLGDGRTFSRFAGQTWMGPAAAFLGP